MKDFMRHLCLSSFALLLFLYSISAAPLVRTAAGANPAAIQAIIDTFRADLGGVNNGVGGSFTSGRREINWDGVPDSSAAPNFLAPDFFNITSPRGLVMNTIETSGSSLNDFIVSADSSNPTGTPVEFADIDASYPGTFQPFSAQRLFTARGANLLEITFFIPGTQIPATVAGFGAVFTDVDVSTGPRTAKIAVYAPNGTQLAAFTPSAASNGLSFAGVSFTAGERIARVTIQTGNAPLESGNVDSAGTDVIAMDDFIYGEPRSLQYHPSDFDGDGTTDRTMFRPGTGQWFVLQSGTNTLTGTSFGINGDIPVEGDFDGDSKSDFVVFRPSSGIWFINQSSNGQTIFAQFGAAGDKPVPGDYDKDGKTDPAVWRPSNTGWYSLRSSTNYSTFDVIGFGLPGDIPVQGAGQ